LHAGPTIDGFVGERFVDRLLGEIEVQYFGQQREAVDFLWQGIDEGCMVFRFGAGSATTG
jgi:hypothetical protein